MFPAHWRQVLQQAVIDRPPMLFQRTNCFFQINRVPQYDGRYHQIQAGSAVALIFKTAVAYLAQPVEEYCPGEGIPRLALVQSGIDAPP